MLDISAPAALVVDVLGGDAKPADEVGEGVGAALVGPGEGVDGFVDLRVVTGLLWRGPAGLVEGARARWWSPCRRYPRARSIQWWPTRSRGADRGSVNLSARVMASVPSDISTARPTNQICTLVGPKHNR